MPKSLSSHSTRSTTSRTARSESTMSADTVPSQGRSGSAASGSHFQRRVLRSSSSSSVNTVQRVEWTELTFPALNVLWPADAARIADEALACATYHLWTLRPCPSDPKHKFCVAAQPFSSVNRKHTTAKTALTLPIQYSELARQFYSAWNVAIYAFRSDAVSIPREARDPEVHALRRVMRYLKAYLISLYSIHGAILDSPSDGPNALLSFAA
ncbi:hypothetical protein BC629DRAFT_923198 [Irpex lacteus]|nr:hypothetical protein BC629DRAFT_923198 [Irpex lacteus]